MKKSIIIIIIFLVAVLIIEITLLSKGIQKLEEDKTATNNDISNISIENNTISNTNETNNKTENKGQVVDIKNDTVINEWNLKLVNYENSLPSDFVPQLSSLDTTRQFDTRAIGELKEMIGDMKKDNISDIWVQSSYRSIEQQQKIFNKKIDEYIKKRKIT